MRYTTLALVTGLALAGVAGVQTAQAGWGYKDGKASVEKSAMAEKGQFDQTMFDSALTNGDFIIVDVYKDGCPTCAQQHPTLEQAKQIFPTAKFFSVNFTKEVAAQTVFKAPSQSTIIVYKNGAEVNRSTGQTDATKLLTQIAEGATS